MRVRILSDVHLEFRAFGPPSVKADVVVLAGDVAVGTQGLTWARETFRDERIVYVIGNHECYGRELPAFYRRAREVATSLGIDLLECNAVSIGDVRFLGATLWTDYALLGDPALSMIDASAMLSDHRQIKVRDLDEPAPRWIRPHDMATLHATTKAWLATELARPASGKTVVVTHHAISRESLAPQHRADSLSPAFASPLDAFVAESGAALWIHGHTHWSVDFMLGRTRVVANQRGYTREETGFRPELVIEI
ncbi:MAG: metallophosphoesterase [Phycisphaerae bacterium]|nr:metallophosphoesterase [Phycisphaerae bacterium]